MDAPKFNTGMLSPDELKELENQENIVETELNVDDTSTVSVADNNENDAKEDNVVAMNPNSDGNGTPINENQQFSENIDKSENSTAAGNANENTDENQNSEENPALEENEQIIDFSEEAEYSAQKKSRTKKKFSVIKFFLSIILIFVVCLSTFGIWNRWFRYDDATDIISNWQVHGSNAIVTIDKKQIVLDKDTSFTYEIDTGAKTIYLHTGNYDGVCHYRFSWDRCQLAFIDSCGMDAISTAFADICWFSDYITCAMNGIGLSPAYTKETGVDVDTTNTGLEDIISSGQSETVLLDKISTKKAETE